MHVDIHMPQRTGSKIIFRWLLFRCQHSCLHTSHQHTKWRSCLLSCQPWVTVTSCFVYKVIRDLESIDHLCINPIRRIGLIHEWSIDSRLLKWGVHVSVLFSNGKQSIASLSLLVGTIVVIIVTRLSLHTAVDSVYKVTECADKRTCGKTHWHTCKQTNMRTRQTQHDLPFFQK